MPQSLNIAICEDEVAETKLLCDILDHSDIKIPILSLQAQMPFSPPTNVINTTCCSWTYT